MHGDVKHCANQTSVVCCVHIDLWSRERQLTHCILHLRMELGHQVVEVGHLFCVVDGWRRPSLVQVLYVIYPPCNFLALLVGTFD